MMKRSILRTIVKGLLIVGILSLVACGGGDNLDSHNPDTGQSPPGSSSSGGVQLTWSPPGQTEDGSSLTDLAGYRIYYGSEPGVFDRVVELPDPSATGYSVENLAAGTWYFRVTAYDADNNESRPAPEVSKSIQ